MIYLNDFQKRQIANMTAQGVTYRRQAELLTEQADGLKIKVEWVKDYAESLNIERHKESYANAGKPYATRKT